jgi:selenide,water dikinase
MAPAKAVEEAVAWLTTLNRAAADLMRECNASAATDVTGFGLIGHCSEMAQGSGLSIRLWLAAIPLMFGVTELMADGMVPAGCYRNRDHYAPLVGGRDSADEALVPLFDPQTSGGLLVALAPEDARRFVAAAGERGIFAARIGEVLPVQACTIEIA